MIKYNKATATIEGSEVELSKRVFLPKERGGFIMTRDGKVYERDAKGTLRRMKPGERPPL